MKKVVSYFLIVVMASAFGCSDFSPSSAADELEVTKYFDLKGFMQKEVERLSSAGNFTKTTYVIDKTETQESTDVNLQKELAIFSDSDINRPAWSDKYKVDSVFNDSKEIVQLSYRAMDEKLRTRQISIDLNEGAVSEIKIENMTSTAIADARQSLVYKPMIGYSIESRQKVKTIDEAILKIEVKF